MKNRIIKFRAWDNEEKIMTYSHNKLWRIFSENVDFDDIQQYTGLKDKNGKEIYEGDIVREERGKSDDGSGWKKNYLYLEVKYENGLLLPFYEIDNTDEFGCDYKLDNNESEIIGNIYENKELLN